MLILIIAIGTNFYKGPTGTRVGTNFYQGTTGTRVQGLSEIVNRSGSYQDTGSKLPGMHRPVYGTRVSGYGCTQDDGQTLKGFNVCRTGICTKQLYHVHVIGKEHPVQLCVCTEMTS
jgi:hypothetical protein